MEALCQVLRLLPDRLATPVDLLKHHLHHRGLELRQHIHLT